MAAAAAAARSWSPDFKHSDRERWICIYPAYINSRKKLSEGRRVALAKAVDNPQPGEIRDVVANAGLVLGVENKIYPREVDRNARGRIRVQLKNDDGSPVLPQFKTNWIGSNCTNISASMVGLTRVEYFYLDEDNPNSNKRHSVFRQDLLEYICETIPKLKGRQGSSSSQQQSAAAASAGGGGGGGGGAGKKGKKKK